MGLFDHFPYTNVHELNLDWLLTMMKALEAEWDAFTAGNSLTFADPLQHDTSKTYAKNTIVIDGTGNSYVSLQAVPVGVGLQNGDYWLMVFDYEAFIEKVNKNFTANYYRGSYRATSAMAIGDWLTVDDVLCKATAAIAADDVLEVGVNIEHFTLEDFIKAFMTSANQMIQQYKNDIDASELLYRQQLAQDIANTTASLQAQLDAAISGATVDSEVINARVDWESITHPTLGDAIRSQITNAFDEFRTGFDSYRLVTDTLEQGSWTYNQKTASTRGVRNRIRIPIKKGDVMHLDTDGLYFGFSLMDNEDDDSTSRSEHKAYFTTSNFTYTFLHDGFLIFTFATAAAYADMDDITPDDITATLSISHFTSIEQLIDTIDEINADEYHIITIDELAQGGWTSNVQSSNAKQFSSSSHYEVHVGDRLICESPNLYISYAIYDSLTPGISPSVVRTFYNTPLDFVVPRDGYLIVQFMNASTWDAATNMSVNEFNESIFIKKRCIPDSFMIDTYNNKRAAGSIKLGYLQLNQSFVIDDNNYFVTDGNDVNEVDSSFQIVDSGSPSIGHANAFQLSLKYPHIAYSSAWNAPYLMPVDLTTLTRDDSKIVTLYPNADFTSPYTWTGVYDDLNDVMYILRTSDATTPNNYEFIIYDVSSNTYTSKLISEKWSYQQGLDFYNGLIYGCFGDGGANQANGIFVMTTSGEILAKFYLDMISNIEIEDIFINRNGDGFYILCADGYLYYVYSL